MLLALAPILVAAAQPAATPSAAPFVLRCSLVGREGARARFAIAASGGARPRFEIRPEGQSRWVAEVRATSVRGRDYHFVSGGTAYRLAIAFDPGSEPLTAHAELAEDRGLPALNVELAEGSCRASPDKVVGEIAALPEAPAVRGESPPHRPVRLPGGRVPSDCTIVLRDLSELTFGLEATFDPAGLRLAVTPEAGQAWPAGPFTVSGAMLAAITQPPGGPPGGVLTIFASAGRSAGEAAPAQIDYFLRAEPNNMDGWIELRSASGGPPIVGAGHCAVRAEAGQ